MAKSKLFPRSGSVAFIQLNPIHKKGPQSFRNFYTLFHWAFCKFSKQLSFKNLFSTIQTITEAKEIAL